MRLMQTIKKAIFVIIFIMSFLFFASDIYAADINYSIQPGATASCIDFTSNYPPVSINGDCSYIHDDIVDNNMYHKIGVTDMIQCDFQCQIGMVVEYKAIVNFAKTAPLINKIEIAWNGIGSPINVGGKAIIDLYYNGIWNEVATFSDTGSDTDVHTSLLIGNWSNVSAIRARARAEGYTTYGKPRFAAASHGIWELRAWGATYIDIGLRAYDGANIIKIAAEPLGILTSPLRIFKNGNIYGIVLVNPSDPYASKIRIQTKSGIKSLRKY